jgi:hypothetical protein
VGGRETRPEEATTNNGRGEKGIDARIATYKIRNGRAGNIEIALRVISN